MAEARNLRNMIQTQTPLLGDENTPLHTLENRGTGFEGATPRHHISATPNPLATPFRGTNGVDFGATPRSEAGSSVMSATPLRTPMRDSLNINDLSQATPIGDTPAQARRRAKDALRRGFAGLPTALNNFEIDAPEDEEPEVEEVELSEEDAAERDAKLARAQAEEVEKALKRRSMVVQQGLPRPVHVDLETLLRQLSMDLVPSGTRRSIRRRDWSISNLLGSSGMMRSRSLCLVLRFRRPRRWTMITRLPMMNRSRRQRRSSIRNSLRRLASPERMRIKSSEASSLISLRPRPPLPSTPWPRRPRFLLPLLPTLIL